MINLNQQKKRVEVKEFEIQNQIIFNFFDKLPATERDEKFIRALNIGVLALMEDRLASFLAKTSNELGTELESLKLIFDMKTELFYGSSIKGSLAEEDIAQFLGDFFKTKGFEDKVALTGNKGGALPKNKTGDIICEIEGRPGLKIVLECKFDKSIRLGEMENKDIFTKKTDTAWSQLIEAQVNRESKVSIIIFDKSIVDISILKKVDSVSYVPAIGLVAIVDSQRGDYTNLVIAYMLARDIAINSKEIEFDEDLLGIIIRRIIKDLEQTIRIKEMIENNIENNKAILKQLEKSMLSIQFSHEYLSKFLKDGKLTKKDLLDFYTGEEIRDKYKLMEKEIQSI